MSLVSLLSIARTALLTQRRAMEVTAHNIANAQTPGFSRQRLDVVPMDPLRTADGSVGRGVTDRGIARARDRFFDAAYRRESGRWGNASTLRDGLSQVEEAMGEPSELGIAAVLDQLFGAFADLANEPSSAPNRDLARQAGERLAQQLQGLDRRLEEAVSDAHARLQAQVDEVNDLLRQIGSLNSAILGSGATHAGDLLDRRDGLLDRLASLMQVRVLERSDGTVSVLSADATLVDGASFQDLRVTPAGSGFAIVNAAGSGIAQPGGSVGGLLELLNLKFTAVGQQLDALAAAMVTEFNAIHRTGYTLTGSTGLDFFDPAGVTAGSIRLSATVAASSGAIAAAGSAYPGDGAIALRLSALGETALASLGGRSAREYYTGLVSTVGLEVSGSAADADVEQALVDQADARRSSVSGVSVDEEMVALIAQQQAYGAAARLIRVADDMIQDLLRII